MERATAKSRICFEYKSGNDGRMSDTACLGKKKSFDTMTVSEETAGNCDTDQ
jgi:hypothetical protein